MTGIISANKALCAARVPVWSTVIVWVMWACCEERHGVIESVVMEWMDRASSQMEAALLVGSMTGGKWKSRAQSLRQP